MDEDWITIEVERALYVDAGKTTILCDRLPSPVTLVLKPTTSIALPEGDYPVLDYRIPWPYRWARQAALVLGILGGLTGTAQASVFPVHVFNPFRTPHHDGRRLVFSGARSGQHSISAIGINDGGDYEHLPGRPVQWRSGLRYVQANPSAVTESKGCIFGDHASAAEFDYRNGLNEGNRQLGSQDSRLRRPDIRKLRCKLAVSTSWNEVDGPKSDFWPVIDEKFLPLNFRLFSQNIGLKAHQLQLSPRNGGLFSGIFYPHPSGTIASHQNDDLQKTGPHYSTGQARQPESIFCEPFIRVAGFITGFLVVASIGGFFAWRWR